MKFYARKSLFILIVKTPLLSDNQPSPTLESEIGPGALHHHEKAVLKAAEIKDVNEEPH